ncbi:MAG: MBL fold metallo-hydrolase [Thermoguttaceae bacterium]|nr:MBL fold metallo-hydrolase [Thermoguttaceae bacterium]
MKIAVLCENSSSSPEFEAEHGLSFYVETSARRFLFDFGASSLFLRNAERLGIDVSTVDVAFLSHGHRDHGGGLAAFFEKNRVAPVYAAEKALRSYYSLRPNGEYVDIGVRVAPENAARIVRTSTGGTFALDSETLIFSDATPDPPEFRSAGVATLFERFEAPPSDFSESWPSSTALLDRFCETADCAQVERRGEISETCASANFARFEGNERIDAATRFAQFEKTEEACASAGFARIKENKEIDKRPKTTAFAPMERGEKADESRSASEARLKKERQVEKAEGVSETASIKEMKETASSLPTRAATAAFEYRPDRFLHEQNLIATTETGRKILFVGCAHRGIVAAMTRATELLGAAPDVAIGGFHLSIPSRGASLPEETLDAIAERLRAWPTRYLTAHCTGRAAFERVRRTLGEQINYFAAGDRFEF